MKERDTNVEPPEQEPKLKEPSSGFEPEGPKGSAARKWIVLLVILAVVGAAVWKICRNAKEQDSVQQIIAGRADPPTPGAGLRGGVEKEALFFYAAGTGAAGVNHL